MLQQEYLAHAKNLTSGHLSIACNQKHNITIYSEKPVITGRGYTLDSLVASALRSNTFNPYCKEGKEGDKSQSIKPN